MKKILVLSLLVANLFAVTEENIISELEKTQNNIISILADTKLDTIQKKNKLFNSMDNIVDFKTMGKISLSDNYKNLKEEEVVIYDETFATRIKNSFIDKLDLYNNQKMELEKRDKLNDKRIEVKYNILSNTNEKFPILYKFFLNTDTKEWFVYDIDIVGVSLIQVYRTQFKNFLLDPSNNINKLIESLKKNDTK